MIKIDRTDGRYPFPTIDFKFRNTESVSAFLWRFTIQILEADVDVTPALRFDPSTREDGSLWIGVTNDGWGPARDVALVLSEPIVDQLFDEMDRTVILAEIPSGERVDVLAIHPERMSRKKFSATKERNVDNPTELDLHLWWRRGRRNNEIGIGVFHVHWSCVSVSDTRIARTTASDVDFHESIFLGLMGFSSERYMVVAMEGFSDRTYCCVVDPSRGKHDRVYDISRKIPPGDVERFHIMIGASMSCKLRLRFVFRVNEYATIESEAFVMEIDRPRNGDCSYADGDIVARNGSGFMRGNQIYPFMDPARRRR